MCSKAAPATIYRKCGHKSDGVEKTYKYFPGECLSVGPSQGLVYAINQEIVIKVPFQYPVLEDTSTHHLLDLSLRSFVSLEKELAVYQTIKAHPHLNITRRLETDEANCLFLERLTPLEAAWRTSNEPDRRRWALELLDAVRWLENQGWANGDLAVRNLGVDSTNRLKVFDFGSAVDRCHPDYENDLRRDHFDLATCLHFILSGIDPFTGANSYAEVKKVRATLESGHGVVGPGAEVLTGIIQDGWTGRGSTRFSQDFERAFDILGPLARSTPTDQSESHYQRLESHCRDWLHNSPRNPHWKDVEGYLLDCKAVGLEADMDMWR
ncbi:hypothetical protein BDP55DRAFT_568141 [Colletotrichum godetiae]|uniref:Protein kinase domain-containing protein n=1 Tax=Colletotrichum godetiae TaxID=1209918 RepID=A0AAJ0A6Z3_9PEZI|nr:uncharacterized protein BDP55DRAFT_568141 [Colletotrichum godetiae]KAK1657038.1 hypothetical protein BDP55DRAFT_568141 [Colletotrichum godetiae]